jgi:signal transduction histidine kinase
LAAGDAARQRIERDLHDSTQQRLVALRIHLTLAGERMDGAEQRSMVEKLGTEVEEAIDELRTVASGTYPQALAIRGIVPALRSVAQRAAIPVRVDDQGLHRHAEPVELAVYFTCLEALQNAAKHAGPGSTATVRLAEGRDAVEFSIEDDGVGFEPQSVTRGAGLRNIADRVAAAGGTVSIDSALGTGTRIRCRVPSTALQYK